MIKKIIIVLFAFLIMTKAYATDMTISVIYNNVDFNKMITSAWGMSCFIEGLEKTILFDTGGDGSILLSNMYKMRIKPEKIDIVFLSHIHEDHTGGLWKFLEVNPHVIVYLPSSFPENFKQRIKNKGGRLVEVVRPIEIFPGAYSTGELGNSIREQSLVLKTKQGLIIITGCSHPGIVTIANTATQICQEKIYLIMGGFHLGSANAIEIKKIINELKALGVEKIAPSHCTGERAINYFKDAWKNNFIDAGCGAIIEVSL
jgi:7,8-dihydropterin-6-yl-methyl-4-(beta-D-ribofuranosyl)aminobenzene 5'-phosphate synthase